MSTSPPVRGLADHHAMRDWQNERILGWSRLLVGVIGACMAVVFFRVVQLKVAPDPRLAESAGTVMSRKADIAPRGALLDRRGRVVAHSTIAYRLFVDPQVIDDLPTVAVDIAELIDADPIAIDRRLHEHLDRQYVVIDQLLEPWQAEAVRSANLRGVGLTPRFLRRHPFGTVAGGLIGAVGFEHQGVNGLERRFDIEMAATRGHVEYLRDVRRMPLWVNPEGFEPATPGAPVRLSLDLVIQEFVEARLAHAVEEFNAGGGRVVAMDCRTGEILAMHDMLQQREGWDDVTVDPLGEQDPLLARCRCVTDPYEPGSTFKPFVWGMATELGLATPDETLPTPDEGERFRTEYGRWIRDSHPQPEATWRETLIHSLNSGMAAVAERMTHAQMQDGIARFGFGERTGIGLPGETRGLVTSRKRWSDYTQSSVAFGHEISVTPVQMVRAFSALASDGAVPTARLSAATETDRDLRFLRRALTPETAQLVRQILREVVTDGTGWRAESKLYSVFGKSGTAQLPKREGGGYHEKRYTASFIGGAPLDEPRIVVVCVIDDPDRAKGHWGGQTAGPVVKDIIDHALQYMGVAPDLILEEKKTKADRGAEAQPVRP